MANAEISIKYHVRPCVARGKKGLFYTWIEKTDMFQNKYMAGLVEFEDGSVDEIHHSHIKFCDNSFKQFAWEEMIGGE